MAVEIPAYVIDHFKKEVKEKGSLVVEVDVFDKNDENKFLYRHGLTFASDLHFHGANSYVLGINEYLSRLLTFSVKPIKIYVNRTLLSDIVQLALPPVVTPVEIDLSNTGNDEESIQGNL